MLLLPLACSCTAPDAADREFLAARLVAGGLCADGPCRDELTITQGRDWVATRVGAADRSGRLTRSELQTVTDAIATTDLANAPSATGDCATAADGREVTYRWATATGVAEASSCQREIPADDVLVTTLDRLATELA